MAAAAQLAVKVHAVFQRFDSGVPHRHSTTRRTVRARQRLWLPARSEVSAPPPPPPPPSPRAHRHRSLPRQTRPHPPPGVRVPHTVIGYRRKTRRRHPLSNSPKKRRHSVPKTRGATRMERQRRLTLRPRSFNATATPPLARVTTVARVRREAAWAQDGGSARRRVQEADARQVRAAGGPSLIPSDAVRPDRARGCPSPLYRDCMKTVDA